MFLKTVGRTCRRYRLIRTRLPMHSPRLLNLKLALIRMPRDFAARFFERVQIGTPVTVVGSTHNLTRVRKAIPILLKGPLVLGQR